MNEQRSTAAEPTLLAPSVGATLSSKEAANRVMISFPVIESRRRPFPRGHNIDESLRILIACARVTVTWKIDTAVAAFRKSLAADRPDAIVERELLNGEVRAFAPDSEKTLALLRRQLGSKLMVRDASIFVVGSAKTGFSLDPSEFPREYRKESDIDVVVVDAARFDKVWLALVRAAYYDRWAKKISQVKDQNRLSDEREHVSLGYVHPELCAFRDTVFLQGDKTLTNEQRIWFDAFQGLGGLREFAGRTVNGRLYRTRDHVVAYHAYGLEALRARIGAA